MFSQTSEQNVFSVQRLLCTECLSQTNKFVALNDSSIICIQCYSQQNGKSQLNPQVSQIIPGFLFIGNQDAALDEKLLKQNNIEAVLTCGAYLNSTKSDQIKQRKVFPIYDHPTQNIAQYFQQSYQWLKTQQAQKRKVLVHCAAGVSRSASFTIAFVMKQKNLTFNQANRFVKQKRKCIYPNRGFKEQLQKYQHYLDKKEKENSPLHQHKKQQTEKPKIQSYPKLIKCRLLKVSK